jgi:hypothetical protein
MLILLISWLSYAFALPQQADVYYVVHVHGLIINQSKKDTVHVGDKLYATDKLIFKSPDARATVLSTKKGRFTLGQSVSSDQSNASAGEEFMALLKNVLVNEKSTERLSTRGLEAEKVVDLKSVFNHKTFAFTGRRAKLILDPAIHPMSGEEFFMYRYTYSTDKTARKKIPFSGDTLIFDAKVLYTVNGRSIPFEEISMVEIYKVNVNYKSSMLIAKFTPVFIPDEQLKAELAVIHTVLQPEDLSDEATLEQMHHHIEAVYGQTDLNLLKLWVKEHMTLHK